MRWQNPEHKGKMETSFRERWDNGSYREHMSRALSEVWADETRREQQRQRSKKQWEDPVVRERNQRGLKKAWEDNEERRAAASERQQRIMQESGRAFRTLYDTCQECGNPKTKNDRELCLSCAGVKRMTELYGDLTYHEYSRGWNEKYREKIRERDGRKCVLCGKTEKGNGRRLDVHHLDYDRRNIDPENLLVLCQHHHGKTNWNRPFWQQVFTEYRGRQPKQDWQHRAVVM